MCPPITVSKVAYNELIGALNLTDSVVVGEQQLSLL